MTVELFTGTPEQLKVRLEAIIALPKTINDIFKVGGGTYIILYT